MEKISIITDTWTDFISGVVTSLVQTKKILEAKGFEVRIIHSGEFHSIPLPYYPQIKFALVTPNQIGEVLKEENPDYVHIATEGPMGLAARMWCVKHTWNFTTSYHTHLPDYVQIRVKGSKNLIYGYLRWFHSASQRTLVSTQSLKKQLESKKFINVAIVPLGVDTELFRRNPNATTPPGLTKPVFVFLGRIAPEKNIEAFLQCDLPGSKLIIGDGPQRISLEEKFAGERAVFTGHKTGQELVDLLSISDVMVFPSLTDTFGMAILEAMACEVPAAAFDVPGPKDIISHGVDGYLGDDLAANAICCLALDRAGLRKKALTFSWEHAVETFTDNLVRARTNQRLSKTA